MGCFYGIKIRDGEINHATGLPWVIDDVPKLWKRAAQKWIDENT